MPFAPEYVQHVLNENFEDAKALFLGPLLLNRSYMVGAIVSLALFTVFVFFFRTRRGVVLRAIADDYMASWAVGISVERGVALSWALSSLVATTAGVLWGSLQGVAQSLSLLLLKGITVAVLGGMDSLGGASYVAREVIGAEEIVDYTYRENVFDRFARRLGTAMAQTIGTDLLGRTPVLK